jgi:preprotein translocase subunit YajC
MILNAIQTVLAGVDTGSCSAGTADAASCGGSNLLMMLMPLAMIVILLVVMIIPQRRRDKKVKDMLSSLKQGDRVRTIGGIYGTISSVKDDVIVLSVGPDKVKLVFARGAISQVEDAGVENTMTEEVKD